MKHIGSRALLLVAVCCWTCSEPATEPGDGAADAQLALTSADELRISSPAEALLLNGHNCCTIADAGAPTPQTGCSEPSIEACVCAAQPSCCTQGWGPDCVIQTIAFCGVCQAVDPAMAALLTADSDEDGIDDLQELAQGMDPQDPADGIDTDGDGIPNRDDVDLDGDGIPNLLDPDIDGDGISNGIDADIDGDGLVNAEDGLAAGPQCASGDDCDDDNGCTENKCVSGMCFNPRKADGKSCDNDKDSCNKYTCKEGQCTEFAGAKDLPDQDDPMSKPVTCNDSDPCTEEDKCQPVAGSAAPGGGGARNECKGKDKCDDGIACTIDFCSDEGQCLDHVDFCMSKGEQCDPQAGPQDGEQRGQCKCGDNDSCGESGTCDPDTGMCSCGDNMACAANEKCDDGVCKCGDGPACGGLNDNECKTSTCTPEGACDISNKPEGADCGDDSDTECDNPDACDGEGNCLENREEDGYACGDAGDGVCELQDTCEGGHCVEGFADQGTDCGDADQEPCLELACDGSGECEQTGEMDEGTACGDQTDDQCNNPNTCNADGECVDNFVEAGTPCDVPDDLCAIGQCDGGDCMSIGVVDCGADKECDPLTGLCCDDADPPECCDPDDTDCP